ncbi:MAG: integration host factor, partial [Solirubrobacteraceae bacterium]
MIGFGGRASIGELLLDPPAFVQTANVFDMLLALPKVGRVKATKIMNSCRVSPNKTLGGLSDRQRAELAER